MKNNDTDFLLRNIQHQYNREILELKQRRHKLERMISDIDQTLDQTEKRVKEAKRIQANIRSGGDKEEITESLINFY